MSMEKAPTAHAPKGRPIRSARIQPLSPDANLEAKAASEKVSPWRALYSLVGYVPPWCRYDPEHPAKFSLGLNILFGKYIQLLAT
jgi:hypothetical protein